MRLKPDFIFPVIVFVEFLILDFGNPRDIFQVIFKLLVYKFHEILSSYLILDIKFRLHFIEKRLLDGSCTILTCDMRNCIVVVTGRPCRPCRPFHGFQFRHHVTRSVDCKRNTIPVNITEIIAVTAWNNLRNTGITHPLSIIAFIIQEFGFSCSEVVFVGSGGFNVFIHFHDGVVSIVYRAQSRSKQDGLRLLLRVFIRHPFILDEFINKEHREIGATHGFLLVAVRFKECVICCIIFLVEENGLVAVVVFL